MKLLSFAVGGRKSFGAANGSGVVTLNDKVGEPDLRSALAAGKLQAIRQIAKDAQPDHQLEDIVFLAGHLRQPERSCARVSITTPMPPRPVANYRSSRCSPASPIRWSGTDPARWFGPRVSDNFDFEGELTVVIGAGGRAHQARECARSCCRLHLLCRRQRTRFSEILGTSGQEFSGTGPLGPWLVTTDEIPDPSKLTLTTRLNGQEMQRSGTDLLIYSISQIIAFCSDFTALSPGDIIATGTPEGVGHRRKPPLWMKPGDTLEVEITGIGRCGRILSTVTLPALGRHETSFYAPTRQTVGICQPPVFAHALHASCTFTRSRSIFLTKNSPRNCRLPAASYHSSASTSPGCRYRSITSYTSFHRRCGEWRTCDGRRYILAFPYHDLATFLGCRIDQLERHFAAQLNEQLLARIVMIVGTRISPADHHHHHIFRPVVFPELPVVDGRQQSLFVVLDPGIEIDRCMFKACMKIPSRSVVSATAERAHPVRKPRAPPSAKCSRGRHRCERGRDCGAWDRRIRRRRR